jgi:hypothetical protein
VINKIYKELRQYLIKDKPRKILFDHLPKCGGSTLSAYLRDQYPDRKIYDIPGDPFSAVESFIGMPESKRHGFDLVQGHMAHMLLESVHPESLKVTVFREPIERIVSYYYFAKKDKCHYLHQQILEQNLGLEEFIKSELTLETSNWYVRYFTGRKLNSENHSLSEQPSDIVNEAFEHIKSNYDIVGFLDKYDEFIQQLSSSAGFKRKYKGTQLNKNNSRPLIKNISESAIQDIVEYNRYDIELYQKLQSEFA